ncbi:MAG: NADPH-dependent F420 reductase [Anaerolineae bacterium]|nr:NADPH-dependent F420 reductase [Anaerolineae bacterium]
MTEATYIKDVHTIAIIGGTGKEGKGLAYAWAKAGYKVLIGSRQQEKAVHAAQELNELLATIPDVLQVDGMTNPEVCQKSDLNVITVPFSAHVDTLTSLKPYLAGKILIDVTVPLVPPKVTKVQMPEAGSAAQEAQAIVGDETPVVAAFQNISYENLLENKDVDCDVIVCGTGKEARGIVISLVEKTGLLAWDGGPIENAVVVEGLTSILIGLNKQYGVESSGIRITGIEK